VSAERKLASDEWLMGTERLGIFGVLYRARKERARLLDDIDPLL